MYAHVDADAGGDTDAPEDGAAWADGDRLAEGGMAAADDRSAGVLPDDTREIALSPAKPRDSAGGGALAEAVDADGDGYGEADGAGDAGLAASGAAALAAGGLASRRLHFAAADAAEAPRRSAPRIIRPGDNTGDITGDTGGDTGGDTAGDTGVVTAGAEDRIIGRDAAGDASPADDPFHDHAPGEPPAEWWHGAADGGGFAGDGQPGRHGAGTDLAGGTAGWPADRVGEGRAMKWAEEADFGPASDTEANMFDTGEPLDIDAEALRDLVAEIIRQELQGTLGERITRSVRKLVRREINRILEARDLE
jgi:hypothetical protein